MIRMLATILLLACSLPAAAHANESAAIVGRIDDAVAVLRGRQRAEAVFDAVFLATVPPERLADLMRHLEAENGKLMAAEAVAADGSSATFRLRFVRATASAHLTIAPQPPFKVSGLRIGAAVPIGDTFESIAADFAALPGASGAMVARLGEGPPQVLFAAHADRQLAVGSAFKLWVLDALAEDVAAGRLRWDQVIRLGARSLPGGLTQDWPPDAPVTVETLATLMMSISDNTATDTLIALIGRDRIGERLRAAGHSHPARMLPLLTTAEAFALKLGPAARRESYARGDDAAQRGLLEGMDAPTELASADIAALAASPVAIDSIEWFASPADLVRVLGALRRREDPRVRAVLGVAPNLDAAQQKRFAYAGYKGGSESGVLSLNWLLRSKAGGEWFAVTASWNDTTKALDNTRLEALAQRLLRLAAAPDIDER